MKISSVAKLGAVAAASLVLLAACGSKSSDSSSKDLASDQTLNWYEKSEIPTMDSSKSTDVTSGEVLNNVNEGLLRFGTNSKLHPGVAKTYSVSKDGKTYTFNLRKSKWSNGKAVTANDFVYAWQRTLDPKTASQYAYLFDNIKNATKVNTGKLAVNKLGVKADGDYKLVVTLDKPQAYFKMLVANPSFFPQLKSEVTKLGSKYASNSSSLVYNGPFKLTNWNGTSDSWDLVKNKNYWNAKNVKLKKVHTQVFKDPGTALNQFNSKKLDATILSGTQVKQYKNDKQFKSRKSASTFYLEMNQKKDKIFKNKKARQAISMVIDKKQFVNHVLADGSIVANNLVSQGLASKNGEDFTKASAVKSASTKNVAEAQKLWKEALKETGEKSISLDLLSDDTDAGKKTTEFLQSQLTKLPNLKITNQNLPFKTRLSRSQSGDFDLVVSAWGADFPDPISFLSLFTSSNSYNNGSWSNKAYDTAVKNAEGKDANNSTARWNDMVTASKTILQDQGIVPLYQQVQPQLVNSKVKGLVYFPTGANWDYSQAYIGK
ncbi:peptide ABC transporter substrate-binding protein [Secundilactobacillus malefermentans]|uniref:Solute-binding protein family 5 domain-containing protein n=1 Tax=Secundilactobacillus malefermentans TaxID=176292 RepID=A0A4R5NDI5_9LACO|nr:peptide ABC transporter substrate-binding protein [Secundilactobacillus malefermentans]KRM59024.1 ABC-type oligopeptide transport system, periplasmic component [Secundilactobacillus malefermentans DSM 5705 = KCTC 3548]QEA31110.1 peptide ABC transporter substrate-binding protein [Secundilactobacillus malefermentans]TDG71441.1 hypothetical protein C5L31_002228 [Secundilactobacillus malefermentans]